MTKWEYRVLDSKHADSSGFLKIATPEAVERYLNGLGADGWEVVNLDFHEGIGTAFVGVAKRPATDEW